jgi:penicillin-binding protein 2
MMIQETLSAAAIVEVAANSVWVGALVAAAVALTLKVYAPASATARYRVWLATLAAVALVPAALWLARVPTTAQAPAAAAAVTSGSASVGAAVDESRGTAGREVAAAPAAAAPIAVRVPREFPLELVAGMLVGLAAAATIFRLSRIAHAALWCVRARRRAAPLPEAVEARLDGWLRLRDGGRRARVLVSPDAAQPVAIGFFAPAVILPSSLVGALEDADLDNIVLHELGHVRRVDDWMLLAQRLLEAVLVFNPVVAWTARRLDVERELACDEWVVAVTRTPRDYARSLLRLAELRLGPACATLAPGALERSHLSRRIESILRLGSGGGRRAAAWVAAAVVAGTFGVSAWIAPTVRVSEAAEPVATAAATPADATPAASTERLEPLRAETLSAASAAAIGHDDASREDLMVRGSAVKALGDRAGTVIVMDPKTGRVLTIVNQEWALRRTFSPASTAKLVTSIAGLRTGTFDPSEMVAVPDFRSKLSLDEAIAYSNTSYFEGVGERAGLAAILENARMVGFGQPTGIDLPGEVSGRLPDPQADARAVGGRGKGVEVTPIQLAAFVSAIANDGLLLEPRLGASFMPLPVVRRDLAELRPAFARLRPGLLGAVQYGSARPAHDPTFPIAGKTGTYNSDGYNLGWFASFEATSPRYAVVVLIAGKGVMGADAARVALRVYKEMGC